MGDTMSAPFDERHVELVNVTENEYKEIKKKHDDKTIRQLLGGMVSNINYIGTQKVLLVTFASKDSKYYTKFFPYCASVYPI